MPDVPLAVIGDERRRWLRAAFELADLIEGEVYFDRHHRMLYATDASIYQVEPLGVVLPASIDEAVKVMRYCHQHDLPLLPRGGGTALAGQSVNRAVVLDFSRHCTAVRDLDPAAATATVEPGVVLDQLNRAAAPHGLMFGPDVATSTHATLGGMIGNNSAGAHSLLYGRTVEHLAALDVALADGTRLTLDEGAAERDEQVAALARGVADIVRPLAAEIRARYPTITRRVDGYNLDLVLDQLEACTAGRLDRLNLAHLVCGSEGTLATVLGATVNLVPAPEHRLLALVAFPSLDEALASLQAILSTGPAAVELVDDVIMGLARGNPEYRNYVQLLPRGEAVLYVEYYTSGGPEALQACLPDADLRIHTDPAAQTAAWKLRKAGEPLLHSVPGARKPLTFIEDTAVDPARLPQFVREFRDLVAAHGTTASYFAHASVGCLHIRPLLSLRDDDDRRAVAELAEEVTELVKRYGGSLSGEHGDGRVRSHLLRRFYGDAICDAFAAIKGLFDPDGRLNPGNIVDPPPMLAALRVQPGETPVQVPAIKTFFHYRREDGFAAAVELCNGAGMCRKVEGGTMCPSYRALLEERHTTRGRANALRLAISGQLGQPGQGEPAWEDADTIETLELCLSCKACKAECPSNVDVARLKAEYTGQRYAATGLPLREWALGNVRRLHRLGSAVHPLTNALNRFPPTAAVVRALLDLDRRRSLPRFRRSLYASLPESPAREDRPVVLLYPDCFTVYTDPHVGRAAARLLEACGYRVVLPRRVGCCGRAMISGGAMELAIETSRASLGALQATVETTGAVAVVGCEPSCVSAIRDDWPDLDLGGDPGRLAELVELTALVEQFVEDRWDEHPQRPDLGSGRGEDDTPILLHGHCHQKALWGLDSSAGLLRRAFGARLTPLDTGCCGMAGTFGYRHFDLSMAIAEQDLMPALVEQPQSVIAAPGTSCRHQILDATGRTARHPVELIASLIAAAQR